MALISLDGTVTALASAAAQGATTITIADSTLCAKIGTGNHTYLRLGDGTYFDVIRVDSCLGAVLTLAAPLPRAYPAGACARYVLTGAIVCEMIGSGSCSANCQPVSILHGADFPDVKPSKDYAHAVVLGGTAPFALVSDSFPSWMTKTIVGNVLMLGGTAPATAVDFAATAVVSNCGGGSTATVTPTICRCAPVGL
jgi:hypothetical protein